MSKTLHGQPNIAVPESAGEGHSIGGVPEHFNLPWHTALAQQGPTLGARWVDYPGGTGDMCRALASGDLDVAVLLTEGIVKHIEGGGDARIVGSYTKTPLLWGIHTSTRGQIERVEQLEGARFAISRMGSGSHLMAQLLCKQHGWPEPEWVIVGNMDGGHLALLSGEADVFMWEKTMSLPRVHGGDWRRVGVFEGPWPAFVIAASAAAMRRGTHWLPALLQEVDAVCDAAQANREATVAEIGAKYDIPNPDLVAWLDDTEWDCRSTVDASVLETVVDVLASAGILDGRPAPAELVAGPGNLAG